MNAFRRYPHVRDLILHYAAALREPAVPAMLSEGVRTAQQAEQLSLFIWRMVEHMHQDERDQVQVLGATDNTEMIPDLHYEISNLMADCGFESVWLRVCAES